MVIEKDKMTHEQLCSYYDELYANIIKRDRASTEHANNPNYRPGQYDMFKGRQDDIK